MKVNVEYINHSGYLVETENHILLFDYIKGNLPEFNKPTLIISTHGHEDHFNRDILDIQGEVRILLSSDIKNDYDIKPQSNVFYIEPNAKRFIGDFQIETFGSTDKGLSVFVSVDNIGIFHAGDLNLWVWDEDTEEERAEMSRDFNNEIKKIRMKNIDIAMFPVDPRLGRYANSGVIYFINNIKPRFLFPMHCWGDTSAAEKLQITCKTAKTKIFVPKHDNERFEVTIN